jgi:hypothetical protein
VYYVLEVGGGYLRGGDVEGEDFVCEVFKREVVPFGSPVAGEGGDLFRNKKAAVGSKPFEDNVLEGEL